MAGNTAEMRLSLLLESSLPQDPGPKLALQDGYFSQREGTKKGSDTFHGRVQPMVPVDVSRLSSPGTGSGK